MAIGFVGVGVLVLFKKCDAIGGGLDGCDVSVALFFGLFLCGDIAYHSDDLGGDLAGDGGEPNFCGKDRSIEALVKPLEAMFALLEGDAEFVLCALLGRSAARLVRGGKVGGAFSMKLFFGFAAKELKGGAVAVEKMLVVQEHHSVLIFLEQGAVFLFGGVEGLGAFEHALFEFLVEGLEGAVGLSVFEFGGDARREDLEQIDQILDVFEWIVIGDAEVADHFERMVVQRDAESLLLDERARRRLALFTDKAADPFVVFGGIKAREFGPRQRAIGVKCACFPKCHSSELWAVFFGDQDVWDIESEGDFLDDGA